MEAPKSKEKENQVISQRVKLFKGIKSSDCSKFFRVGLPRDISKSLLDSIRSNYERKYWKLRWCAERTYKDTTNIDGFNTKEVCSDTWPTDREQMKILCVYHSVKIVG